MGWGDLDNGDLLDAIGSKFDVLVTMDRGMSHQQQLIGRAFGLLIVRAKSNRMADLIPVVPRVLDELQSKFAGRVREVS